MLAIEAGAEGCTFVGGAGAPLSLSEAINSLLSLPTDLEVWLTLPHLAHAKPLGMVTRQFVERDESHFALLYTRD